MIDPKFSSVGSNSWEVEKWVRKHSTLTGSDFLVALTVASLHNPRYGYAFPSYEQLVEASRVSGSTVKRAIGRMKDSGEWIIVTGRGGPEGSRNGARARANRYYPTAVLAGVSARPTEPTEDFTFTPEEAELSQAAEMANIIDPESLTVLRAVWAATPEKYRQDFLQQLSSGRYINQFTRIISLSKDILAAGEDIGEIITARLKRSKTAPAVISSWLATWGLRLDSKTRRSAEPDDGSGQISEFMLHGAGTEDVDYGSTGQEF